MVEGQSLRSKKCLFLPWVSLDMLRKSSSQYCQCKITKSKSNSSFTLKNLLLPITSASNVLKLDQSDSFPFWNKVRVVKSIIKVNSKIHQNSPNLSWMHCMETLNFITFETCKTFTLRLSQISAISKITVLKRCVWDKFCFQKLGVMKGSFKVKVLSDFDFRNFWRKW